MTAFCVRAENQKMNNKKMSKTEASSRTNNLVVIRNLSTDSSWKASVTLDKTTGRIVSSEGSQKWWC